MTTSNPALPHWLVIGFTGHRKLANPDQVAEALRHAIDRIAQKHLRITGISSAASGSDTLFAEEMARRNCPFTLVLPFPRERFQQDFNDDPAGWTRIQLLMTKAIQVEVPAHCTVNPDGKADAAYMDAGYRTIDRADVLIAVWGGKPSTGFGGTADAVAYARAIQRPLLIIDPQSGRIIEERLDTLAHPSRDGVGSAIDPIMDPRAQVESYFTAVTSQAKKHGPRARFLVRICLQLYLLASAFGFANLVFHNEGWRSWLLSGASALTMAAGLVLMVVYTRSHDRWLQFRVEAEVCRSFLATWDICRHATLSHQPRAVIPDLKMLFADLWLLRQIDRSPLIGMDHAKSRYNRERVEAQINYFQRELEIAKKSRSRRKLAMKVCSVLAVISLASVFFLTIRSHEQTPAAHWMHFLGLTFPLMATSLGLTLITQESVRRAARYAEMLRELKDLHLRLVACNTWDALDRVATEVEEQLLQELVEWRSFIRFTRDVARRG